MNGEERRVHPRIELDLLVNYSDNLISHTRNISEGGVCILAKESIEKGRLLNLVFSISDDMKVPIFGKTVWNREVEKNLYENGIKFFNVGDDSEKLRGFINNKLND